jgi:hypothetical protein
MSELTDWEPEMQSATNLIASHIEYSEEIRKLEANLMAIDTQHARALNQCKQSYTDTFNALKDDAITALKAIAICIKASIPNDHSQEYLTHRARNFRMKHIDRIITDQIAKLGDRKLSSYEDDKKFGITTHQKSLF